MSNTNYHYRLHYLTKKPNFFLPLKHNSSQQPSIPHKIFDVGFLLNTRTTKRMTLKEQKTSPKHRKTALYDHNSSQTQPFPLKTSALELNAETSFRKKLSFHTTKQFLFDQGIKQKSLHSRRGSLRKSSTKYNKRNTITMDKQSIKQAKQRVRQTIINGEAIINFSQPLTIPINGRLEGRLLTRGFSNATQRRSSTKMSNKTMQNPKSSRSAQRRQAETTFPGKRSYRPWSPIRESQRPGVLQIDSFLSNQM